MCMRRMRKMIHGKAQREREEEKARKEGGKRFFFRVPVVIRVWRGKVFQQQFRLVAIEVSEESAGARRRRRRERTSVCFLSRSEDRRCWVLEMSFYLAVCVRTGGLRSSVFFFRCADETGLARSFVGIMNDREKCFG